MDEQAKDGGFLWKLGATDCGFEAEQLRNLPSSLMMLLPQLDDVQCEKQSIAKLS